MALRSGLILCNPSRELREGWEGLHRPVYQLADGGRRSLDLRLRGKDQSRRPGLAGAPTRELVGPDGIQEIVRVRGDGTHCCDLVAGFLDQEPMPQCLRRVAVGHRVGPCALVVL